MLRKFGLALVAASSLAGLASGAKAANNDIYGGGSTLGAPVYLSEFGGAAANYCATPLCPPSQFHYAAVGSGTGTSSFLNNAPAGDTPLVPAAGNNPAFTAVHFGASDAAVNSTQVSSFVRVPSTATYPMIQVPSFGIAVTIPFVAKPGLVKLTLTDNDLCGIFSGKITNWNQTSANPSNKPIKVVYRSDGSGTSFTLLTHLSAPGVCTTGTGGNSNITFTATTSFASLFGGTPPANFVGASGSGGVQAQMLTYQAGGNGAVGYVGPDYTSIVASTQPNASTLPVASLVNRNNGVAYQPWNKVTAKLNHRNGSDTITPALATVAPPAGQAAQSNPVNWGIFVPSPSVGYPIVGYTYLQFSQCYKLTKTANGIKAWLNDMYRSAAFATIIENEGFVTVPNTAGANYVAALTAAFTSNTSGFNLDIQDATVCAGGVGR